MYVYKCILLFFFFLYLQLPEPFFVLCCHLARQRIKNIKKERDTHTVPYHERSTLPLRFVYAIVFVYLCVSRSRKPIHGKENNSENIYEQELKTKDEYRLFVSCMCVSLNCVHRFLSLFLESNIESLLSSLRSHSLAWKSNGNFSAHNGESKKCTQRHSWQSS